MHKIFSDKLKNDILKSTLDKSFYQSSELFYTFKETLYEYTFIFYVYIQKRYIKKEPEMNIQEQISIDFVGIT